MDIQNKEQKSKMIYIYIYIYKLRMKISKDGAGGPWPPSFSNFPLREVILSQFMK